MHMLDEIEEEKNIAERIEYYRNIGRELWNLLKNKRVILTGSGTSYNASVLLSYVLMGKGLLANSIQSSEVPSLQKVDLSGYVSVLFSHSGESSDILRAAQVLKKRGSNTISITDFDNSELAKIADVHFNAGGGEERSVAATKSHFAQCMLSFSIIENGEFSNLKNVVEGIIKNDSIQFYGEKVGDRIVLLGTGVEYPLAMEGALKLQETSESITYHYPNREFLHGPIQILDSSWSVLLLSRDEELEKKSALYDAHPVIIGDDPSNEIFVDAGDGISLYLGKLTALQLLSYYHAISKGLNPDKPSKLTKVVK